MRLTDYYMLEEEVERLEKTVKRLKSEHESYVAFASVFARKTRDLLLYLGLNEKEIAEYYARS